LTAYGLGGPSRTKYNNLKFIPNSLEEELISAPQTYNGVNPTKSKYAQYQAIQEAIFNSANGTGDVVPFLGFDNNYGSFAQLGNLTVGLDVATGTESKDYELFLDLETGVAGSRFETEKYGKISRYIPPY